MVYFFLSIWVGTHFLSVKTLVYNFAPVNILAKKSYLFPCKVRNHRNRLIFPYFPIFSGNGLFISPTAVPNLKFYLMKELAFVLSCFRQPSLTPVVHGRNMGFKVNCNYYNISKYCNYIEPQSLILALRLTNFKITSSLYTNAFHRIRNS